MSKGQVPAFTQNPRLRTKNFAKEVPLTKRFILAVSAVLGIVSNAAAQAGQDPHRAILAAKFQKQPDAIADSTPSV